MLTVTVSGGGVKVVTGVDVDLRVALLVKVKATETVGTGFLEDFPNKVVQACRDFVESAETREENRVEAP